MRSNSGFCCEYFVTRHSAMNALNIYLSTCRYVLQIEPATKESWSDLYRFLPYLRQALTCCVCGRILEQPVSPMNVKACQHHVCKKCIGGKMKVRPSCSWCKDWDQFVENTQLRILLQCFKELCCQLQGSPIFTELTTSQQGERFKIATILEDAMNIEEYKYPAKNKFANISSWPPPHFTFLATNQSGSSAPQGCVDENTKNVTKNSETSTKIFYRNETDKIIDDEEAAKQRLLSAIDNDHRPMHNSLDNEGRNVHSKKSKFLSRSEATDPQQNSAPGDNADDENVDHHSKRGATTNQSKRLKTEPESTRKVCRCGTANVPNKLTCYCQRCPCYSLKLGCFGCKCRGCRNPYNKRKAAVVEDNSMSQDVNVET